MRTFMAIPLGLAAILAAIAIGGLGGSELRVGNAPARTAGVAPAEGDRGSGAGLVAWAVQRANASGVERTGELPPQGLSGLSPSMRARLEAAAQTEVDEETTPWQRMQA